MSFWMYSCFVLWLFAKSSSSVRWRVRRISRSLASSSAVSWSAARRRACVAFCAFDKEGRDSTRDFCWGWEGLRPACVKGFSSGGGANGEADREAIQWGVNERHNLGVQRACAKWGSSRVVCWTINNQQCQWSRRVTSLPSTIAQLCTVSGQSVIFLSLHLPFFQDHPNRLHARNQRLPKMVSG